MKLKIDDKIMYGDYTEEQIDLVIEEMKKPKEQRKYILGIEFSLVEKVEVLNE